MANIPAEFTDRLRTEGEKTATFFGALDAGQWQKIAYSDVAIWTALDVMAHLLSADREFLRLFKDVRAGGQGVPEDFSIDEFNARAVASLRTQPAADLVTAFMLARKELIEWVEGLDPADLLKMGRHPFLGVISLGEMIKMVTLHEHIHVREVRRLMENP